MSIELPHLMPRQIEILQRCSNGQDYGDIAAAWECSAAYVKRLAHETRLLLGASTIAYGVAIALRHGIIE